jgi:hypothetical protein
MVVERSTPMVRLVPGYRQNVNVRWGMNSRTRQRSSTVFQWDMNSE